MAATDNIHPVSDRMLSRTEKQALLRQRGVVMWFSGLSGSGKSTVALALERKLHAEGILTELLDGDNIRTGLNKNLGFSDEDRLENIRRIAEVSKLFAHTGVVVLCSFITPTHELRAIARDTIGSADIIEVFVKASFQTCESRDVKGLYAKARAGKLALFTGKDSDFEIPQTSDLVLDTEKESITESCDRAYDSVISHIRIEQ